jgi:hypothetical protein
LKKIISRTIIIIAFVVGIGMGFRYVYLIVQKEIHPALATWVLFCVAVSLSFRTYWSSKKHSIVGNVGNFVDLILVWIILVGIFLFGENNSFLFRPFEIGCLVASGIILLFWVLSKKHLLSNLLLQVIMTVAYFPTIYNLWYATKNTESFSVWCVWLVGGLASLVIAVLKKDTLGIVYSSRAFVLVLIILILMLRIV